MAAFGRPFTRYVLLGFRLEPIEARNISDPNNLRSSVSNIRGDFFSFSFLLSDTGVFTL